jgi:hypothetical protein
MPELIPFRWPASWTDAAPLDLLKGTPVNCVAGETPPPIPPGGLPLVKLDEARPPEGVTPRQGVWPRAVGAIKEGAAAGATGGLLDENAKREIRLVKPGFLLASLNPVCADAAAAAVMVFDPMAARGAAPFEKCDNTLDLAEQAGIGSRDLRKFEVIGARIAEVRALFR